MIKDLKFLFQKFFLFEHLILKKRILTSIDKEIEKEYKLIPELSDKNLISLDIGVFRGVYSYILSQCSKSVIGFEANPLMYKYLEKNLKKIISNLTIHNVALSNKIQNVFLKIPRRNKSFLQINTEDYYEAGLATIHEENNLDGKNYDSFAIKSNILNNFNFIDKVGFIKIDTEGHELCVLEGSTNILKNDKPNLLIEIEHRHSRKASDDIFYFLKDYGYSSFIFKDSTLKKVFGLVDDLNYNNYVFKVD